MKKKLKRLRDDGIHHPWVKIMIAMKLSVILVLLIFMQAFASKSYSQKTLLNLKMRNATVKEVLREIEDNSEFYFLYNGDLVDVDRIVSINVNDKKVDEVLNILFSEDNVNFIIKDRQIVLSPLPYAENKKGMEQTNLKISGKVTDSSDDPLPGVTVIIKGTTNGTVTNADGVYSISNVPEDAILLFSFVGMKTQEITVAGKVSIDVVMTEDYIGIDEVVAIGYGVQKKSDLTGAVSTIKIENSLISNVPNVNALQTIKGNVPGINIGEPTSAGGSPSLIIRGQNSIKASNSPLLVVDGVIFNGSFSDLNPDDIAAIDILRDASASAVYGSRAANGVILVTTKRGKTGKPMFNFNAYYGVQDWTNRPDMMKGEEFITWKRDVAILNGASGSDTELSQILNPKEYEAYQSGHTIDWLNEVTQFAPIQNYQLSISGATDKTNYYISGNYLNQTGIIVGDDYKKYSLKVKFENEITDWMKIGINLNTSYNDYSGVPADIYMATYCGPYGYKYVTIPGYDDRLERYPQTTTSVYNPLWQTQQHHVDRRNNYWALGFAEIKIPWVKGLKYNFNYSIDKYEKETELFQDENYFINTLLISDLGDPSKYLSKPNGYRAINTKNNWLLNHILSYSHSFGNNKIDATLMAERQKGTSKYLKFAGRNFSEVGTTVLGVNNLELSSIMSGETELSELMQTAYMGRINYVNRGRYHASFSIRKDGYSAFSEGHKYGLFSAMALAWTVSEESFMKEFDSLDYLKLRLSYGENGNPSIDPYGTFPSISNSYYIFGETTAKTSYQSSLGNKDLEWEKTTALNVGVDFSILRNIISGNIDLYKSRTTNLLLERSIPITTGYSSILDNIGEIENKGIEIALNSINIKNQDFSWKSSLAFWLNRNKVISLYGIDADGDGIEDDDISNSWFIGKSLGAIYDYTFDGIVQSEDTEYQNAYNAIPGDVRFKDISGPDGIPDGKITTDDRSIIGYEKPNYTLNLSNTFKYKNFELYFDFHYISGGGKNNYYMASNPKGLDPGYLMPGIANWLDKPYWMPEKQNNRFPRPTYSNPYDYGFYQNHSFLRLQNLTFGYTFDHSLLEDLNVDVLKVYFSGKNLLTFSDWIGLDPESATQIGNYTLPGLKIFTVGVNLTF